MRISRRELLGGLALLGPVTALHAGDLDAIRAQPKLVKRAKMALKNADAALTEAREAYSRGEPGEVEKALREVSESAELARESLKEKYKNPRKHSKPFKRAEIATRKLLRRLDTFRDEMSYRDRGQTDEVIGRVRKVHEGLLRDVMGENQ